jgi:CYTH domain-containing protein
VTTGDLVDRDRRVRSRPPDWCGREFTGRTGWSNTALARNGRPN